MSDPTPFIATIKHLYNPPIGVNIVGCPDPKYNRTWSGTFGDGNVSFSLPKDGDCIHGSAKFMCVFCEKWYGVKKPTIISSMPSYLEKTGQPSNLLLSGNATSETHSASLTQSPLGLFQSSPDATKSKSLHSLHDQKASAFHLR